MGGGRERRQHGQWSQSLGRSKAEGKGARPQLPLHATACILLACCRERGPGAGGYSFDSEKPQDGRGGKWGAPSPAGCRILHPVHMTPRGTSMGDRAGWDCRPKVTPGFSEHKGSREPLSPTCNSGHNLTCPLDCGPRTMACSTSPAQSKARDGTTKLLSKGSLGSGPAQE